MSHVIVVAERSEALVSACRHANVIPFFARDIRQARTRVRELGLRHVQGLCVDLRHPEAADLILDLRDEARFFHLPILALVECALGDEHRRAITLGATDAIAAEDASGIALRLAAMRAFDAVRPGSYRRTAVIAHHDLAAQRMLARAARRVGQDPVTVDSTDELRGLLGAARLPVGSLLLDGESAAALDPATLPAVPTLVVTDTPAPVLRAGVWGTRTRFVVPAEVSEDLAFHLGELQRLERRTPEPRRSQRVLNDGICAFRPAGTRTASLGVMHDLGADGLYVRTMAPLPEGLDLWIELRPDPLAPWIHLRAVVVWRRRVGDAGYTSPRGFALRLVRDECSPRDLEVWDGSYRRQLEASRRMHAPELALRAV